MAPVGFWERASAQLLSLPHEVRMAFEWAILELERDPSCYPHSPNTWISVSTATMAGPDGLRRIEVRRGRDDPGFRGIYLHRGSHVIFLRFAFRDRNTYKRIDKELGKLLSDAGLPLGNDG